MDGLRETLFDTIDRLRDGKIDEKHAKATAALAMTLIKSVEVQMEFEKMKLEDKMPRSMPTMPLIPKIPVNGPQK